MTRSRAVVGLVLLMVAGLVGVVGGIVVGFQLESHDSFCASCHTQPETQFYRQSTDRSAPPVDLAASHAQETKHVRCINCHGGVELGQHLRTFFRLAVYDTLKFYTGNYKQPARTSVPIPNATCAYCHAAALTAAGFDNHFHNMLASQGAPPLACVDCHPGHVAADAEAKFVIRRVVFPECNACHRAMGKGPSDLQ
jgi:hypothetical protein